MRMGMIGCMCVEKMGEGETSMEIVLIFFASKDSVYSLTCGINLLTSSCHVFKIQTKPNFW